MSKFVYTLLGSLLVFMSFGMLVSADEGELDDLEGVYYDYVNDQYVHDLYTVDEEGNLQEISFEEYMEEVIKGEEIKAKNEALNNKFENNLRFNNNLIDNNDIQPYSTSRDYYYRYQQKASGQFLGRFEAVTNPLICPIGSTGCSEGYSVSRTKTVVWGASLNLAMKKAITSGVSFSATTSATNTVTYTLGIPAGKRGWVEMAPYWNYSGGDLITLVQGVRVGTSYKYTEFPATLSNGNLKWLVKGVIQ